MSKFNHLFELKNNEKTAVEYSCDGVTARVDFVSEGCYRISVYKDKSSLLPTFCVNPSGAFSPNGRDRLSTEDFALFSPVADLKGSVHRFELANGVALEIDLNNFTTKCIKDGNILLGDRGPLAYNFQNEFGAGMSHYLLREKDEKIFGVGDKGGALDKNGRAFRIETTDCMGYDASESDPLYKHVPFYICENSVGCYGIFYDTADTSYLDFGREINNYYAPFKLFKTEDDCLVYYVFLGSKLEILQQFTKLCGKQPLPPRWSFDYCASTMAYTDAPRSQEKMHDFIERLKEFDLSCGGFYLSSGYTSIGNQRCVFHWNNEKFPDVRGFVDEFVENGINLIPNIKPAFLTTHPLYNQIAQDGLFVKNPDGTPFVTEFWDGLGSYLDFTNPRAFDFWSNKVDEALLDYGFIATWNDNNEFDIKDNEALAVGFNGKTVKASRIRSVLTYLMVASSYQAQIKRNPTLRPFLSTRSGGIGVRRFAQTWSGDNRTEFKDLRFCHNIGLTMSLSGMYFYGHDLGGFSGDMPSRELLLRWLQHGIFEPRLTIHSWNNDGSATMPWSYPDIMDSVRSIFAQRKQLLPYIYNSAYASVENELPMNAPAFLYFDDERLFNETDAMMLGKSIYVAFAFDEGVNRVNAYLPKGADWYLGNKMYNGGESVQLEIKPTDKMPYFVKAGSVVATDEAEFGFNSSEDLTFTVYPLASGSFEDDFFTDDGKTFAYQNGDCVKLRFAVNCTDEAVTVSVKNLGSMPIEPKIRLTPADNRELILN